MKGYYKSWYLLYTRPQHEKKVFACLSDQKITSFLPMRTELRTWWDRKKYVESPLFPSYLFVYLKDSREYLDSLSADGALHYVRFGKEIARVAESVIDNIRLATVAGGEIEVSPGRLEPGQQVEIRHGALTGLRCEVVEFKGKKKYVVRVDLLQRNILLSVPAEDLIVQQAV